MNRLRSALEDDRAVYSAWLGTHDPLLAAQVARPQGAVRFGAVAFDMQHNMATEHSVVQCMAAVAASGLPGAVRIPVGRFEQASKALDAGAHMVIAPMINSAADAEAFAGFAKFPPLGERSFGVGYAASLLGTDGAGYCRTADRDTLAIAMIETVAALDALDDILALPGIDGVFCGPADLSISIADRPEPTPFGASSIEAVREIAGKARGRGKLAATYVGSVEHARMAHEAGYRFMAYGNEAAYLRSGIEPFLRAAPRAAPQTATV